MLVGGLAVQLHGFQRSTFDIDPVLAMNGDNLSRFIGVAKGLGLTPVIPVAIESFRSRRYRRFSAGKTPMFESPRLDEQLLRRRLQAFEDNRSFFIQMWLQNPNLAERAGPRIAGLLAPLERSTPNPGRVGPSP